MFRLVRDIIRSRGREAIGICGRDDVSRRMWEVGMCRKYEANHAVWSERGITRLQPLQPATAAG